MTKVTFRYDEPEDESIRLTLRITLGNKHLDGPCSEVVKLVGDYYNKKFPGHQIDVASLCLKVLGGVELSDDANVREKLTDGNEVYLLPKDVRTRRQVVTPPIVEDKKPVVTPKKKAAPRDKRLRCKRFGCNQHYEEGAQDTCRHHKAPPIFHETAKYWSCCTGTKAYDWEDFERIPGCEETIGHTQEEAKKKFLGGTDLRAENAPERIDGGLPSDPRKQLDMLRKALMSMGIEEEFFDRMWGRLAAKYGDLRIVTSEVRKCIEEALEKVSAPNLDMPDH
eukprot:GEMP01042581.1.p1 GENE.GEMP01042581.1~~GEMP01042581.1.p1  ORF type:complete len:280 (+),score=57.27 GEMP01042581.1:59-898(+)